MSRFPWFGLLLLAGCTPAASKVETPAPRVELAAQFDPAATGTVRGQVSWRGPVPGQERTVGVVPDGAVKASGEGYRRARFADPDGVTVVLFEWCRPAE